MCSRGKRFQAERRCGLERHAPIVLTIGGDECLADR
jgi:hypothetical protein